MSKFMKGLPRSAKVVCIAYARSQEASLTKLKSQAAVVMLTNGSVAVLDAQSLERLLKQLQQGSLQGVGALQVRNAAGKPTAAYTQIFNADPNAASSIINSLQAHNAKRLKWCTSAGKLELWQ